MAGYQRKTIKWDEFGKWEHGDLLQAQMDKCGYSVEKLAYKMNVANVTIKNWLKNYQGPNPKNFKKLCEVLGVNPGYFLEPTPIEKITKDHKIGTGKKPLKKTTKKTPWNTMTKKELRDLYIAFLDLGSFPSIQLDGEKYEISELSEAGAYAEKAYYILYKWFSKMPSEVQNSISNDALDYLAPKKDD